MKDSTILKSYSELKKGGVASVEKTNQNKKVVVLKKKTLVGVDKDELNEKIKQLESELASLKELKKDLG